MTAGIIFLLVMSASVFFTILVRRYALSNAILDVPNDRSSHTVSTPTGGGLAIVAAFYPGLFLLYALDIVQYQMLYALTGAGISLALIGYVDDRQHVAQWIRIIVHFSAVLWSVYWLDGVAAGISGTAYLVVIAFMMTWFVNLFNFMDGIDGIASVEAIFIALAGSMLLYWHDAHQQLAVALILSAASAGFMVWNWPPAKIFMGDVGSGFLGICLAMLMYSTSGKFLDLSVWLILAGVFIVDASYTLMVRILSGEKWYLAHKSHAYQKSASRYGHKRVTIAILLINVFWLLPLAILADHLQRAGYIMLAIAYIPLVFFCLKYSAGKQQ